MKLSISNIAWSAEHEYEQYRFLQTQGIQGLEIAPTRIFPTYPYDKLSEAHVWATALKENYGLIISSMQSIWYGHTEKIFASSVERKTLIDYTKKAIDFAAVIGCKNLVFGNPKNRDTEELTKMMPIAMDFFKEIGSYAAIKNTIIAIEPNPTIYNTRFINTTEQAFEFVDQVASPGVKVNVDLGTIIYNGENISVLKQATSLINHIHISEPYLKAIEHRDIHLKLLKLLTEIQYDKYVSIEMGKQDIEIVKNTILYLKELFLSI